MQYIDIEQYIRLDPPTLVEIGVTGGLNHQRWLQNLNKAAGTDHTSFQDFVDDLESYQQDLLLQLKHDAGPDDLALDLEFRYKLATLVLSTLQHHAEAFAAHLANKALGQFGDGAVQ